MVLFTLLFYHLLSIVSCIEIDEKFCKKRPDVLYCEKGSVKDLQPPCPEGVSGVNTYLGIPYRDIVKALNDIRKDMAQGNTKYNNKPFPGAGDMIHLVWNSTLERVAGMWARTCPVDNYPSPEKYILPEGQVTGIYVFEKDNSEKLDDAASYKEFFEKYKNQELEKLWPYAKDNRRHTLQLHITFYGKSRFVGCAQVKYQTAEKINFFHLVCCFASAGIPFTPTNFNTPACTCPEKTNCTQKYPNYIGILCEYSRGYEKMSNRPAIALAVFISYLIGNI